MLFLQTTSCPSKLYATNVTVLRKKWRNLRSEEFLQEARFARGNRWGTAPRGIAAPLKPMHLLCKSTNFWTADA